MESKVMSKTGKGKINLIKSHNKFKNIQSNFVLKKYLIIYKKIKH